MNLTSNAFKQGEPIPQKFTCQGEDISPQLSWNQNPDGTQSIALICDDPDAPMGTWVHWVLWNLPADTVTLEENFSKADSLPNGAKQGITDFKRVGYGGPCPPPGGPHRYFFKLYALDTALNLPEGKATGKEDLLKAMEGHILAQAELMGTYQKQ